jgi:RNA-directed DNA polymerase
MASDLTRIREKAGKEPKLWFTSLYHHVTDEGNLYASYWDLEPGKAPGIDGVTKEGYGAELDKNITDLAQRLRRLGYRPQPARRAYIPKPGSGKKRPLGIPCFEDKLVQRVVARVLEQIYEEDFLDCSYGYRPGRTCHEALGELGRTIQRKKVSYVVEADIRGFLDTASYCPPIHEFISNSVGFVSNALIHRPLRRPRMTSTAWSSPRFTRCNTVCLETPSFKVVSSIGR